MIAWLAIAAMAADPCASFDANRMMSAHAPGETPSWDEACFGLRLDLAGRASLSVPMEGISRRLDLARARLETGIWGPGPVSARVALIAARSGGGTSYVGIDGEAIVFKLQIAEARIDVPKVGLALAAGMIDHPWLMQRQSTWGLRIVTAPLQQRLSPRSDLGGWVSWTSPADVASLTASLTTGEGGDIRERNNGMDVTVVATVRPLATTEHGNLLELTLAGSEGSTGIERIRNHRLGGAITARPPYLIGAVEGAAGWGDQGDPDLLPAFVSGWVRTDASVPMLGWARMGSVWADRSRPESQTLTWTLGAGPWLPWNRQAAARPIYVVAGYEGATLSEDARLTAGAESAGRQHLVYVQVGALLNAGIPFSFGRRP